ncbi:ABC transporter substrate-binding protein [Tychonema sp. LEGE 07203]|nr:ABC transporter substrate-binding protein [Tychonema sp. LEGE 07203]MBE9093439.1 ABC transporter substrate-binding protein [Tychonema sp. LEGE 07203]
MIFSKLSKTIKMQLKRVACIFLSLNLLILSGCQNTQENSDTIELTLWHGINPPTNRDVFQTLTDKFNKTHSHIQIKPIYIGQPDQQMPKILTAIVGGAAPDLLWNVPTIAGKLAELNAIQPLEKWLDKSPRKAEIDPALFESMELGGHIWSVPFATNNAAIFYRPSLFKAAGIKQVPQNWAQLKQAARSLTRDTNGDGRPDQHGIVLSLGKGEWTVFTWLPFLFSAGGELLAQTAQTPVPQIDSPGAEAALELWSDLLAEGSAILSAPERGYELDNFIAGKVAMQITGPWTLSQLQQSAIDYAVMPVPALKRRAAVTGGENLFLMKTSPEREKAGREFLEYAIGEEFQTAWALGTGYLPINLKSRQSQTYQSFVEKTPVLQVFLEQMNWARSRPIVSGYSRLSENAGRAIEATLLGKNPQDALKEAQERLTLTLDITK